MTLNTESSEFKERKSIIERPPMKRWKASQIKSKWSDVQEHNQQMNEAFQLLIRRIRKLYNGSNTEVYYRDQRKDSSMNATTMYTFLTRELYLELECDYVHHRCVVQYDFNNCLHQSTIANYLKEYPFSMANRRLTPDGGIAAFFERVKAFQSQEYFSVL